LNAAESGVPRAADAPSGVWVRVSPPFHSDQATTAQAAAWRKNAKEGLGTRKRSAID
jgi:hypothetical protein